eukprot:COSAG03_NODE_42_length_17101_cov_8.739031_1_plen_1207_part_00
MGGALWGALSAALSAAIGGRVAHMSCAELGPLLAQAAEAGGRCDLRYKDIDAEGAAVVAEELSKNPAVTSLNLWKNSIAAGGAKVIASALTANTTLRELDVEGNQLGDDGARAFARALQGNRSLTKLNLAKNDLTDASAKALIVALQRNHTLLELDISKNTLVGLGMKSAIRAALKTNSHREKAMSALKELAQLAASDPASLAAVRRLAGGDGVSKQEMKALDELAQDAGLAPAATQAMHALADAQRQAQVSRAEAEKGVMAAQTAAVASSPALRISGTRPASRPASSAAVEWVAQIDPGTGKTYYWNTRTKTTTWKKPDDYPEESPDDSTDDSAESDSSFDDSDDSDGLGASEDIGRDLPDLDDDDDGDSDDGPDQNAVQQSLQKAMEAGSIAEMAIRHDGNGELVEAVACYKKAGSLLEEAADYSPQSDHFRAKAAEYLSRARVLSTSEKYAVAERKTQPVKLSKKAITQAVSQMEADPMAASVEDVCGWLASIGLPVYVQSFREQLVDGPMLAELTDEQMRDELEVSKMGERGKIRRARDSVFGKSTAIVSSNPPRVNDLQLAVTEPAASEKAQSAAQHNKTSSANRDSGERIKVQVRLGHDGEWINLKLPRSEIVIDALRPRIASALQVHAHALGHLQYRDKAGEWFAALEDDDIMDGIADLGGRKLILQTVGGGSHSGGNAPSTASAGGVPSALVSVFEPTASSSAGKSSARSRAAARAEKLRGRGQSSENLTGPSAIAEAREHRPERPEQIQARLQRLLQDGQMEEAVEALMGWGPGRTAMSETPAAPYNALLKLANDKKMDSQISSAIVQLMSSRGVEPDKAAYTHFLRALIRDDDLDFATRVLGKMHDEGFPAGAATYGGIMEAFAAKQELQKAVQLGAKALAAEAVPGMGLLTRLLQACAQAASKEAGVATFKLIQAAGWEPDVEAFAALVECAVGASDLGLAMKVLQQLVQTCDTVQTETFTRVLGLCEEQGATDAAVRAFKLLQESGLEPQPDAFKSLLECARVGGDLQLCLSVSKQMIGASVVPELATFNLLLALAADKKAKGSAVELFEQMQATDDSKPDEKTFGAMINCSWACNDIKLATKYLHQMLDSGFTPPVAAINALLGSCKDSTHALEIVKIVQSSTLASLDSASYTQLIRCACAEGDMELGGRVLQQALHAGIEVEEPAVRMLVETSGALDLEKTMQILQLLMAGG